MSLDRTSGYDMLVQISETEINNQLATAFLAGTVFPTAMTVPVNTGGIVGTANLNFNTPTADLDRPRPNLGLTVPFFNSQLQVTQPVSLTLSPLAGTIVIVDAIQILVQGQTQIATMNFNQGAPTVTVAFDVPSQAVLAPVLAATGITLAQAQNLMAGVILQQLQTALGRIDLTPPIPVFNDTNPTTVFDIDVTTVNDTTAADRDCITFGIRMANDTGGNINNVTTSFIPAGSNSLVMMSNFWLLARVVRPQIATSLGTAVTNFDTPLRLNTEIPAPGGEGRLTNLEARVIGNRIRVDGRAVDSGTGWSAVSEFNFFIDIGLSGGAITVTATTPTVDTDIDLEWWVWLLSLGLGAVFGGIIGVIVAAIVLAIVEAVAEGIANNLISSGFGAVGSIPPVPLGPIGGGLTLTSVILDDLELRCSIIKSLSVPIKNQGSHDSFTPFAVDLDDGSLSASAQAGSDLIWNPSQGILTNGSAGLTITGASFNALTPVQISRMPLTTTNIPLSLIPINLPDILGFFGHKEVVFGIRTTEGRFAKARASRSVTGFQLELDWITYATPVPSLDIAARWSVMERGEVTEYITPGCAFCRSSEVSWCGVFEAWPKLVPFPIDYQWCLCGTVLEEEEGEVSTSHGPLGYKLTDRRLFIKTEMGENVDCELCVSAIDARGSELFTCIRLVKSGIDTTCKQCTPLGRPFSVEVLQPPAELLGWRGLLSGVAPQ